MFRRWMGLLLNRRDQRRAELLRVELGGRRWLVSWVRRRDGRWVARLSCPEVHPTIERTGWTRCEAIRRAEVALRQFLVREDA